MKKKKILKSIIIEFHSWDLPEVLDREIELPLGSNKIISVVGPRRAGKTYLLFHTIKRLWDVGFPKEKILYFNFEDERIDFVQGGLDLISQVYRDLYPDLDLREAYFFFDEVQKAPDFFGMVKALIDNGPPDLKIFLSGSAQIRLMSGIRESLAGRSVSRELFPFVVEELLGSQSRVLKAIFQASTDNQVISELVNDLKQVLPTTPEVYTIQRAEEHLMVFGGMPYLMHLDNEDERWLWLKEYCNTYLQRDFMDLARINDLYNFVRLERIAALRTGGIINYSSLARDADILSLTAKKYLNYLEISYHVFLVPAYRARAKSRLVKSPRLYFTDLGIQRTFSGIKLALTGEEFETFVVAEILKLIRGLSVDVEYFYFRTKDVREVDLLLKTARGYWAFEVKMSNTVVASDARPIKGLEKYLDGPLLGCFIIYRGNIIKELVPSVFAIPSWMLWV